MTGVNARSTTSSSIVQDVRLDAIVTSSVVLCAVTRVRLEALPCWVDSFVQASRERLHGHNYTAAVRVPS